MSSAASATWRTVCRPAHSWTVRVSIVPLLVMPVTAEPCRLHCRAWCCHQAFHSAMTALSPPRAREGDKAVIAEWNAWWQHHARQWSLHGSAVTGITSKGTMETLTVQLWAGRQTVRQVADAAELIESALAGYVRHGMVRVDKSANPSQALV